MCGIAGIIHRSKDRSDLPKMLRLLAHRGPDADGIWSGQTDDGWQVNLGHRRLSIIDLEGGKQPMGNEDGSVQVTFNGEIYNHLAIRQRLVAAGHRFETHSDTEAIVHHHEAHGPDGLRELSGMFAFGVWDGRTGTLTLARDRAGIKPLYWAQLPCGGIAFASELRALMACAEVPRQFDPAGLASLFYRDYVEAPHTILEGVHKVPPGHFLTWQGGAVSTPQAFWRIEEIPPHEGPRDEATLVAQLREELDRAVQAQLMSDVPLGIFLSGGIDSSIVAALARRHTGDATRTFSIGFEDSDYDESRWARIVAESLGVQHTERRFSEGDVLDTVDRAVNALDEPVADPSLLPTYLLCALASDHVKVALGGDGGDELWAGYPTCPAHRAAAWYGRIPGIVRRGMIQPLIARLPVQHGYQPLEWKLKRFALRWQDDPVLRHQEWMSSATAKEVEGCVGVPPRMMPGYAIQADDLLNRILAFEYSTYMSGSVLFKVDRASMAFGLEVRPPLLDNALIDFAFGLPSSVKLRRGRSKWLLKKAAEGLVPDVVLTRKKKGFGIPLARWIATSLAERMRTILEESPLWEHSPLDQPAFARMFEEHRTMQMDHSRPLWALLILDSWYHRTLA